MKRKRGQLTPRDLEIFSKVLAALRGDYGEEARRFVKDFIATWNKGWTLKRKGHKVRRPNPRPGRPQFVIIDGRERKRQRK
jgi:hypothetical protein